MRERVYRAKYLDIQTSIRTHRNTQHLPDYKTPTLAANDVHFEGGMIEPGLDVEPEEPGGDGVLQVAHLHRVRVLVPAQQLQHVTVRTVRGTPKVSTAPSPCWHCLQTKHLRIFYLSI